MESRQMMWLGILTFPQLESAGFGFFWVVMGLFVGSFLNVCIHRFPVEGASVWSPARSHCPGCDRQLEWRENLPVLSWLLQRGRCLGCAAPIHWRYPLVELIGAAAFYLSWRAAASLGWGFLLLDSIVLAALVVATFVDFERYEIPDQVSIGGMWAAPVVSFVMPGLHSSGLVAVALAAGEAVDGVASVSECFAGMALGGGVLYGLGWIGKRVSGADAMGFGDVKLMAAGGGAGGSGRHLSGPPGRRLRWIAGRGAQYSALVPRGPRPPAAPQAPESGAPTGPAHRQGSGPISPLWPVLGPGYWNRAPRLEGCARPAAFRAGIGISPGV
ncbi:prepilin peptidase [Planctomycetota bacterium]|nr:prepilin peptidase [Planctomycetota bacterium]